jgi:hypothetical protein
MAKAFGDVAVFFPFPDLKVRTLATSFRALAKSFKALATSFKALATPFRAWQELPKHISGGGFNPFAKAIDLKFLLDQSELPLCFDIS